MNFPPSFLLDALASGTVVAGLAGLVGFFLVLRGEVFAAHALPKVGFAGAAGAVLLKTNPLWGLLIFTTGGALGMGILGRRGRHDVAVALILVLALGTGALFLVLNNSYAFGAYALLFGQLAGVSAGQAAATAILGAAGGTALLFLYRPLLFATISPEVAQARGVPVGSLDSGFLLVLGLTAAITVPVVGVLLSFSLLIGPAATSGHLTRNPLKAAVLSSGIAVLTVWLALILAYASGWPIGFFVATLSAAAYALVRLATSRRHF